MARASHRAAIIYGRAHSLTLVQTHAPLSVMLRRIAPHLTVRQPITLLAKTLDGRRLNCFTSGPKKGAAHFCSAITAAPDHRINVDHQTQSRVGVRPYGRARAIEAALTSPPCPLVKRAWVLLGAQISQLHGWSPQRYRPSSPHQPRLQRPPDRPWIVCVMLRSIDSAFARSVPRPPTMTHPLRFLQTDMRIHLGIVGPKATLLATNTA
jgi:hypothetical protein